MKRIIFLVFMIVLLTGCSANVNVTVTSSGIEEEITINAYSTASTSKEDVDKSFRKYMPVFNNVPLSDTEPDVKKDGIEYYDMSKHDLGSGYQFIYEYGYKFNDYKNSKSVSQGFGSKTIQRNSVDKNIMLSTDSSGLRFFQQYPNLESVTINITTPYKVLENNAHFVNGNTYTWVMRSDTKKSIYMLIEDPNADIDYDKEEEKVETEGTKKPVIEETEETEENAIVEFANKHPIVVGVCAIVGFLLLIAIVFKISQVKYK